MTLERNQVKITYNPYQKQLSYQWRTGEGEWMDVAATSPLSEERFRKATLQNRAIEIVETISETYNNGTIGLDIVFEGTTEDYSDLTEIIQCYFADKNIHCIQAGNILISAEDALQHICQIFDQLDGTFQEYPDSDLQKELNRFRDTVKPMISICVMGLYSAGKSAFINALIGEEILPSASDPLTAKTYRIMSEEDASVRFQYNGEDVVLSFTDTQYTPKVSDHLLGMPLFAKLREAVEDAKRHTLATHVYQALKVINSFERDQNAPNVISDVIDVRVPFAHSNLALDDFRFVIYDTPGSNSASNQRHMDILQQALQGQTNGLPIFLTTPDTMDSKDNNEIIAVIDKMANALDRTNTIVIVNRSDEKDSETLKNKKDSCANLRIAQWKSSRIFFVSSIMGLGSKKTDPRQKEAWSDQQYFKVYRQQEDSFTDPADDFYLPLYEYNLLPQDRYDSICKRGASAAPQDRLRHTSGIWGVEDEINRFARKYALYNKCSQAQEYLQNAIRLAEQKRKAQEQELAQLDTELDKSISTKEKQLRQELGQASKKLQGLIHDDYARTIIQTWVQPIQAVQASCGAEIDQKWTECKKNEKKADARLEQMRKWVERYFSASVSPVIQQVIAESENFWKGAAQQYKTEYCAVIRENPLLSENEKSLLNQFVLDCPTIAVRNIAFDIEPSFRKKHVLLFIPAGKRFDRKACTREFQEQAVRTVSEWVQERIKARHVEAFRTWEAEFTQALDNRLVELNPNLASLAAEREECLAHIRALHKQGDALQNSANDLSDIIK